MRCSPTNIDVRCADVVRVERELDFYTVCARVFNVPSMCVMYAMCVSVLPTVEEATTIRYIFQLINKNMTIVCQFFLFC